MALRNKTYRASEETLELLAQKAVELKLTESEIVHKALKCFLGVRNDADCSIKTQIEKLEALVQDIVQKNNLVV